MCPSYYPPKPHPPLLGEEQQRERDRERGEEAAGAAGAAAKCVAKNIQLQIHIVRATPIHFLVSFKYTFSLVFPFFSFLFLFFNVQILSTFRAGKCKMEQSCHDYRI